ncbi:MAG: metallophosphatase family protein [Verrucomicrobiota bacterium]|nr:metallophosphatase family protein [Verrucomicrobiota bacterium]
MPPTLASLAAGADEIWHLGDVCSQRIFAEIQAFGPPVTVVHGNCDDTPTWPLVLNLKRNGVEFRLIHLPPPQPPEGIDVVLHGHTHVPRDEQRGRVRFLNPGCVTRPNRGSPPSVAWLDIAADGTLAWKLVPLR